MLGSVSPNWRAVVVHVGTNNQVQLTFVLASESEEDRKEIDDVVFELSAMQPEKALSVDVIIESAPLKSIIGFGQLIFARKE
ncbi:MAG TPA: hypothetical protein PKE29_18300 [Phycisphaerales bacterium]|nr:hypothetical protein [Phycisphaerales bacterium]